MLRDAGVQQLCLCVSIQEPASRPGGVAEGTQPARCLACSSACFWPWLPGSPRRSLRTPPRNAVPACCWEGEKNSCLLSASLRGGNTAAQPSMENYFNYFRGSKRPLESFFFLLPPNSLMLRACLTAVNAATLWRPHGWPSPSGTESWIAQTGAFFLRCQSGKVF